jgi:hypothetical protein
MPFAGWSPYSARRQRIDVADALPDRDAGHKSCHNSEGPHLECAVRSRAGKWTGENGERRRGSDGAELEINESEAVP